MRWHILSIPLKAGRGISAGTFGLDYVFPPDDLGSGPCTPFIIYEPYIIAAFLLIKIYSFLETYIQKVGIAMLVYWMIRYCVVSCVLSVVCPSILCHGMDIGTCEIVHWSAAPYNRIANRTGFSVYIVLVLNVIRYSCHYLLDRIIFHHDFHIESCDYHWDFYGH